MGGMYEERYKKGRGERKVEGKGQQQGAMERVTKETAEQSHEFPASPLQKVNERKNNRCQYKLVRHYSARAR